MKSLSTYFFALFLITGCTTIQPALTVSNEGELESYPVKGRQGILINQKLSFGDFNTSKVNRSWTKGGNSRISLPVGETEESLYPDLLSLNYIDRNQTFSFQMTDPHGNGSDVYAATEFTSEDLQLEEKNEILEEVLGLNLKSQNLFYLQIFLNSDLQPWQLVLDNEAAQVFSDKYTGVLAIDKNKYYTLQPITKVQKKDGSPTDLLLGSIGYEIFNKEDKPIAAVSLIDGGNVYFHTSDPEEKFLMANLCAALLLQENIAAD